MRKNPIYWWVKLVLFKTLTLEIYRPSKSKRAIIDRAMQNYSLALQSLFERYRGEITLMAAEGRSVSPHSLMALPDSGTMRGLNRFGVEPFKDSLRIEFASIAGAYIAQSRHGPAGYPCVTLDDGQYRAGMEDLIASYTAGEISNKRFLKLEAGLIARAGRVHMLYFGRYALNRDYCLLHDGATGRFYVKLYLLNKADKLTGQGSVTAKDLRYVAPGLPAAGQSKAGRRYLVLPLAFGSYQAAQLKRALSNPGVLHTARIVRRKGHYFLLLNIECEKGPAIKTVTTMGVARSEDGLHFTVPGREAGLIAAGKAQAVNAGKRAGDTQRLYAVCSEIVKKALRWSCQVVLEANGGKNDAVMKGRALAPFSVTDYSAVSRILAYKLPEAGLPAPIEVSANGLYNTCPRCGCKTRKNRASGGRLFACVDCGFACLANDVGSAGLASRLERYKKDRIPVYLEHREGGDIYVNRALDFECPAGDDRAQLYYQLSLLARSIGHCGHDMRKYSMVKKLREAENIADVVRIVTRQRV